MNRLIFAEGLSLPFTVVTDTAGYVGNKGSGKTYGAKRAAESMLAAGAQVVVLDPVDAWYGLRYGRERGESGLPIFVFGGIRADLDLEAGAGALLADVVVERGVSAVLSLRGLNRTSQRAFARDFLERLYLRKGEEQYRTPLHVFLEEAHVFAPQSLVSGDRVAGTCLAAVEEVALQGRSSGLGISLVTQRVAAVAKSVLELVEVLCAFRTTGPNARKALTAWFDAHDDEKERLQQFIAGVTKLPRGEAWVWSPELLDVFGRYKVLEVSTYDSSATPAAGKAKPQPRGTAAPLDLVALGEEIAATAVRQHENDPNLLKAEVAQLRTDVLGWTGTAKTYEAEVERLTGVVEELRARPEVPVEVPVLEPEDLRAFIAAVDRFTDAVEGPATAIKAAGARVTEAAQVVIGLNVEPTTPVRARAEDPPPPVVPPVPLATFVEHSRSLVSPVDGSGGATDGLRPGAKRLLVAVVANGPCPRARAALAAGLKVTGGSFSSYLSALRTRGLITEGSDKSLSPTQLGTAAAASFGPVAIPHTRVELIAEWSPRLRPGAQRMLDEVVKTGSHGLSRAELGDRSGVDPAGGSFSSYLSALSTAGLVDKVGSMVVPSQHLLALP